MQLCRTPQLYEKSLEMNSFKTVEGTNDVDLGADFGTTYQLTDSSAVTIIDPFKEYLEVLKGCFDFDALRKFVKKPGFSLLFDGMHGAGGPFAHKVFLEELGMPEVSSEKVYIQCPYQRKVVSCSLIMLSQQYTVLSLSV